MYDFVYKDNRVKLSVGQLDKLADVYINVGTLIFGSGVISYLIPAIDNPSVSVLLFSLLGSLLFWSFAVKIARRI